MQKIVINGCYGGFSLSRKALHRLRELGHKLALEETDEGEKWPDSDKIRDGGFDAYLRDIPRDDAMLIQVIGELGAEANGGCAGLEIVEVPDGAEWQIEEYDGNEWIAEKHRTWR